MPHLHGQRMIARQLCLQRASMRLRLQQRLAHVLPRRGIEHGIALECKGEAAGYMPKRWSEQQHFRWRTASIAARYMKLHMALHGCADAADAASKGRGRPGRWPSKMVKATAAALAELEVQGWIVRVCRLLVRLEMSTMVARYYVIGLPFDACSHQCEQNPTLGRVLPESKPVPEDEKAQTTQAGIQDCGNVMRTLHGSERVHGTCYRVMTTALPQAIAAQLALLPGPPGCKP